MKKIIISAVVALGFAVGCSSQPGAVRPVGQTARLTYANSDYYKTVVKEVNDALHLGGWLTCVESPGLGNVYGAVIDQAVDINAQAQYNSVTQSNDCVPTSGGQADAVDVQEYTSAEDARTAVGQLQEGGFLLGNVFVEVPYTIDKNALTRLQMTFPEAVAVN